MPRPSVAWIVAASSLLIAMILRILPLPLEFAVYNPDWVLLCLIYWNMAIPDRVGVGAAWFFGVLTDALTGRMLGQHALAYSLVAYICVRLHRRLRLYPLSQQALMNLGFLLLSQILVFWTQQLRQSSYDTSGFYWLTPVIGAVVWPVLFLLLRRIRRHFNIF